MRALAGRVATPCHKKAPMGGLFLLAALIAACVPAALAQQVENGLLHIGNFRAASLKPLRNDPSLDLYITPEWSASGFRMDVWKRYGVPFWYPKQTGAVRVAGAGWRPDSGDVVSETSTGARASDDRISAGQASGWDDSPADPKNAIDNNNYTFWRAPAAATPARLKVQFAAPARVKQIRFLAYTPNGGDPKALPKDYSVGLILKDGSERVIASIQDDTEADGQWREFSVPDLEARGMFLQIDATSGGRAATIHEFEAHGRFTGELPPPAFPTQVTIPMGGYSGSELHFLGNVGSGFPATPDVRTPAGEYIVHYANGNDETIPLIAGENVAEQTYGHFVPGAQFALGFRPRDPRDGELSYYLDTWTKDVEVKDQLMFFSHKLEHPDWPIRSVEFRCTRPEASLLLAAVTLQQGGPRINPVFYNGKLVRAYPEDAPSVPPSPLDALQDKTCELSLDGDWAYVTDPGDEGIRKQYYSPSYNTTQWKQMEVPSQWFLKGLNYDGVVWFRREIDVPASFPGSVAELHFGAVDYDARVWVNGVYAGRHIGAYTSFALNVTSALHKGQKNVIVVRVDSPVDPGYQAFKTLIKGNSVDDIIIPYDQEGSMGGIYQPVTLYGRGDVGIRDLWTSTTLSHDLKQAHLRVRMSLDTTAHDGTIEVYSRLVEPAHPGAKPRNFEKTAEVALNESKGAPLDTSARISVDLEFNIADPLLWYPWEQGTPYLHTLEVELRRNGQVLDRQYQRVGLRQVEFDPNHHYVIVNHHRIFLKGMLNDDPHWRSLMDRRGYAQRIQMQKDANLNVIRMVTHRSQPDMYDLCDQMGMMIWQEMPLQWRYSGTQTIRREILARVKQTVEQTRSHASVIGWSAWNEGGQLGFSDRIVTQIEKYDGTRPLTRASGHGEYDVHIYPTLYNDFSLGRYTTMWTGLGEKLGFVSETGDYGLVSAKTLKDMAGDNPLQFDSVDTLWDNFNSYRRITTLFQDAPYPANWNTEKLRKYILAKIPMSEHWYERYHKFMYETLRATRFSPTTAIIHCRFDDAFPLGFSGAVVAFNGEPKTAYYAVQKANRQVLPILFFDFTGAKDIRVVNEYWFRSWKGAKLSYELRSGSGQLIRQLSRTFDLTPDSTTTVFSKEEAGDLWHLPGGFTADLKLQDASGKLLSDNHYEFTEEEVQRFLTSVYPEAPVRPLNAIVLLAQDASNASGVTRIPGKATTYSKTLLRADASAGSSRIEFSVDIPQASDYYIRPSANSGRIARSWQLEIDGRAVPLQTSGGANLDRPITRNIYSIPENAWYAGWQVRLAKGRHHLVLTSPERDSARGRGSEPVLVLDAIALQPYKELESPLVLPEFRQEAAPHLEGD